MKLASIIASAVLVAGFAEPVGADCAPGNRLTRAQIVANFNGRTIHAQSNDPDPADNDWKEAHCDLVASAELYKLGAGTAVDPRALIGFWNINGTSSNARVEYTYDDGVHPALTYEYYIHADNPSSPTVLYFCIYPADTVEKAHTAPGGIGGAGSAAC